MTEKCIVQIQFQTEAYGRTLLSLCSYCVYFLSSSVLFLLFLACGFVSFKQYIDWGLLRSKLYKVMKKILVFILQVHEENYKMQRISLQNCLYFGYVLMRKRITRNKSLGKKSSIFLLCVYLSLHRWCVPWNACSVQESLEVIQLQDGDKIFHEVFYLIVKWNLDIFSYTRN